VNIMNLKNKKKTKNENKNRESFWSY
jgi:hypothetical protein